MSEDNAAKKELTAVKGTKDILPGEVEKWQKLESLVRHTFELYGFNEIRTPIIEHTELFQKGSGETSDVVTKEMYAFVDKGGRSITLRPEYTPSVVRAIMEHRLDLKPEPLRFYYTGPMFRYDRPQKGRYRQFHQVDVEIFGEKDPAVDAELVEMAVSLLDRLNVTGTETLVNSVGCRECRPDYSQALRKAVAEHTDSFCPDCRRKAELNPLRIFDCKVDGCRKAAADFPLILDYLCAECREHFEKFRSYLDLFGVKYRVDPRLVRGLDYYTKTTFEVITTDGGAQNAILGGGRYDNMMKDFGGPDLCGIGFAMGIERLLSIIDIAVEKRPFVYIAFLGEAGKKAGLETSRFLRRNGVEVMIEYKDRGMKAHFGRAGKVRADWVLIIGEEELQHGRYGLKEMASGRQLEGTPGELLAYLKTGRPD